MMNRTDAHVDGEMAIERIRSILFATGKIVFLSGRNELVEISKAEATGDVEPGTGAGARYALYVKLAPKEKDPDTIVCMIDIFDLQTKKPGPELSVAAEMKARKR